MFAVVPRRVKPVRVAGLHVAAARSWVAGLRGWLRAGLLAVAATVAGVAVAAPEAPVPAVALAHRAEHLKAAFRSGDPVALQAAVEEVELLRRTYGTLDVQPLVEAMAVFAQQLGAQGRPDQGLAVIRTLETWAPDHPTLLGAKVALMRRQGIQGWLWSAAEVLELTRLRLVNPDFRWMWGVHHLAWLGFMATALLWGWALALALRYRRVFRNLWEEPLGRRGVHRHLAALLGAVLLALPVLAGLDPTVVAMVWLWLLVPFMFPAEVRLTVVLLLLQLVHPGLALLRARAVRPPRPSLVALQLQPRPWRLDARAWAALNPGDRSFLDGWADLQAQQWGPAEARFRSLEARHPNRGEVQNNLGVALYQSGRLAEAKACFDQAATLLPHSAEVLVNQSAVAFRQMDSVLGSAKQEQAERTDSDAFARMLAADHARKEQRTFPVPLPDSPARISALEAAGTEPPDRPRDPVLLLGLALPLAAVLAVLLRSRRSVNQVHPSQCVRCGDPFHTTDSPDTQVCSPCHHLFILKDGLHAGTRKRKVDEVAVFQKNQRRLHRLLIVLLPGADRFFMGEPLDGLEEFGFFSFALGLVLTTGRPVRYPGEILGDPVSIWLPLGLVLLAVLFLRSWLKLLPRRS